MHHDQKTGPEVALPPLRPLPVPTGASLGASVPVGGPAGADPSSTAAARARLDADDADWREVEGAHGPCSAVWSLLDRVSDDRLAVRATARLLLHLVTSDAEVEELELDFLADTLAERLEAIEEAIGTAMRVARPASQAEQAAAHEARERDRASDPLGDADRMVSWAGIVAQMANEAAEKAAIIGAEVVA